MLFVFYFFKMFWLLNYNDSMSRTKRALVILIFTISVFTCTINFFDSRRSKTFLTKRMSKPSGVIVPPTYCIHTLFSRKVELGGIGTDVNKNKDTLRLPLENPPLK